MTLAVIGAVNQPLQHPPVIKELENQGFTHFSVLQSPIRLLTCLYGHTYTATDSLAQVLSLHKWGTDQTPLFWINHLNKTIKWRMSFAGIYKYVITDIQTPEELEWFIHNNHNVIHFEGTALQPTSLTYPTNITVNDLRPHITAA